MYEIFRVLDYELDVLTASYDRQRSSTNTATNVNHNTIRWESCPIEAYNDSMIRSTKCMSGKEFQNG